MMSIRRYTKLIALIIIAISLNFKYCLAEEYKSADSLSNSSFEVWGDSLPIEWNTSIGAQEDEGPESLIDMITEAKHGKYAIRLTGARSTAYWKSLTQGPFIANPDIIWRFSGWMRTNNVRLDKHHFKNCNLLAAAYDENNETVKIWSSGAVTGTTEWTKKEIYFKTPPYAVSFKVGVFLSMNGSADFDALKLEPYWPLSEPPATTRDGKWQQDVEFFALMLSKLHVNPFSNISKERVDQLTSELLSNIPSLTDQEVKVGLMRIIAAIGDSHTTCSLSDLNLSKYPFQAICFKDGIYALLASEEHRDILNCRIIRIGDTDITKAYAAVSEVIPHENDSYLRFALTKYIAIPEILQATGIIENINQVSFIFQQADSTYITKEFNPVPMDSMLKMTYIGAPKRLKVPEYLGPGKFYSFKYFEDKSVLYVDYRVCRDMDHLTVKQFSDNVFAFLDSCNVNKCIIDLRANGRTQRRLQRREPAPKNIKDKEYKIQRSARTRARGYV